MGLLSKYRALFSGFIVLALVVFHIYCAWRGMDYGPHWDESYLQKTLVQNIKSVSFIPSSYYYGSAYFVPGWLALLPEMYKERDVVHDIVNDPSRPFFPNQYRSLVSAQSKLQTFIQSESFILRSRMVYIFLSSLTIPMCFFLAKKLRNNSLDGTIAASVIALSWEVNYHSRHIAVDNLFMLFATFSFYAQLHAFDRAGNYQKEWPLWITAIIAGLAASTKYTSFLLIIPCITVILIYKIKATLTSRLILIAGIICTGLSALVISNPGLVLDTVRAFNDWAFAAADYNGIKPGYPYYVNSSVEHVWGIFVYLCTTITSPYIWISIPLFLFGVYGFFRIIETNWKIGVILASFPLAYILFMSKTNLLIVRNLLPLFPILAVAIAIGVSEVFKQNKKIATVVALFLFTSTGVNAYWMFRSAETVNRDSEELIYLEQAYNYINNHDESTFLLSRQIRKDLEVVGAYTAAANIVKSAEDRPDYVVLYYKEHPYNLWLSNKPNLIHKAFSSEEVNYNYYSTWIGRNDKRRIFIISLASAKKMGFSSY